MCRELAPVVIRLEPFVPDLVAVRPVDKSCRSEAKIPFLRGPGEIHSNVAKVEDAPDLRRQG